MTIVSRYFILTTIILFSVVSVYSQNKLIEKGDVFFHKYKFEKAIKKYKKAYDLDSSFIAAKSLALAYQANYELESANEFYEIALAHQQKDIALYLNYAEYLASNRKFIESKKQLEKYLETFSEDVKGQMLMQFLSDREINECNPIAATNDRLFYCVTLDASASIDVELPHLIYYWNFDDGAELKGAVVNHCFGRSGIHTVALSTLDTLTNYRSNSDTIFTLDLSEQLNFKTKGSTIKGAELTFDASKLNNTEGLHGFLWDLGDGHFKIGDVVNHRYTKQGLYRARLYVLVKNAFGKPELLGCVSKGIFINKPILNIGRK